MHINYEEVELLALAFKSKYNRDLIGEDMSQFHIDYDLECACGEIFSTESYFLAKKFVKYKQKSKFCVIEISTIFEVFKVCEIL